MAMTADASGFRAPAKELDTTKLNWGHANSQTDVVWANYRCAGLADMAAAIRKKKLPRCDISLVAHVVAYHALVADRSAPTFAY